MRNFIAGGRFFGPSTHVTIPMDVYSRDPIDGINSLNVSSHDFRRKFQVDILSLGSQHPSRIYALTFSRWLSACHPPPAIQHRGASKLDRRPAGDTR